MAPIYQIDGPGPEEQVVDPGHVVLACSGDVNKECLPKASAGLTPEISRV